MIREGLTEEQAKNRLEQYGKNVLEEEKPKTLWQMFLEQIINWTNLILAIAVTICFVLGDVGEAIIIMVIVLANGIIGVVQEGKAQKALDALKEMSSLKATAALIPLVMHEFMVLRNRYQPQYE